MAMSTQFGRPHPPGLAERARATSPASGEVKPPQPVGRFRAGRRLGELVLRRWVRLGEGSACLSLGRGTQPAGLLATICCVPSAVITPNVVAVKTFSCKAE